MKDITIKQLLHQIRLYAEKHTALFLGICTGAVSVITLLLRLLYYCYQVGYYSYFGIDLALLSEAGGNALLTAVIYVAVACLIVLFNLIGYLFYRNNRLIWYFVGCCLLFVTMFFLILLFTVGFAIFEDFGKVARFIAFLPAVLSLSIHSPLLGYVAVPGKEDRRIRIQNRLKHARLSTKKRQKLQDELIIIENSVSDAAIVSQKVDQTPVWLRLFVSLGMIALMAVLTIALGFLQAKARTVFFISQDQETTVTIGEEEIGDYVVLYQNPNYKIISPCKVSGETIWIYNDHQMQTDVKGQFVEKRRFQHAELK